jgi:glutamate synthase (NADPH/NADH) large chain
VYSHESVLRRQETFGYTHEELKLLVSPMARTGGEALGSMGTDTPVAVLSDRPRLLFDYFQQVFAQVTNPPLDAIREELVTSLSSTIGAEGNLRDPQPESCVQIELPFPIIDNDELAKLIHIDHDGDRPEFAAHLISGLYRVAGGGDALREALDRVREEASTAIEQGKGILGCRRDSNREWAPIPSLLLPRRCTITSSEKARTRSASLWRQETPVRSITQRCSSVTANNPARIWRSETEDLIARSLRARWGRPARQ